MEKYLKLLDGWILVEEKNGLKRYRDPNNPAHYRLILGADPREVLSPNSDQVAGWSSSTEATHWEAVDDDPGADPTNPTNDGDTSYIRTDPGGVSSQYDRFGHPNTSIPVEATINWVRTYGVARSESDTYKGNFRVGLYINATYYLTATQNPTTTYTAYYREDTINPDTSDAWTPTAINSAQIAVNGASDAYCPGTFLWIYYPLRCTQAFMLIDYTVPVVPAKPLINKPLVNPILINPPIVRFLKKRGI